MGVAGEEASGEEAGGLLVVSGSWAAGWMSACASDRLFGLCSGFSSSLIGCVDVIFRSCRPSSCVSRWTGDLGDMILSE